MNRITRKQREEQFAEMAKESFKDHVILASHETPYLRWLVGRPNGSSVYQAEVLLTHRGSVIVYGDVDLVCFASYDAHHAGAVGWIATSNLDYLTSKAAMGTGREVAECWDPEVALDDAWSYSEEDPDDYNDVHDPEDRDEKLSWKQGWEKIAEMISNGRSQEKVQESIYDMTDDSEYCGIGICPSPRVIWAYHLVRRLHSLIEESKSCLWK